MNLYAKLFNFMKSQVREKFMDLPGANGEIFSFSPEFTEGAEAMLVDENGLTAVADGSYKLEDGREFVVTDGLVTEIMEAPLEQMLSKVAKFNQVREVQKFIEAVLSDGTIISVEPALQVGAMVNVLTLSGLVPAPDGEHQLNTGEIVVTAGGYITEIKTLEEEVEAGDAQEQDEIMKRDPKMVIERTEIESRFAEIERKIAAKDAEIERLKGELSKKNEAFEAFGKLIEDVKDLPKDAPSETPEQPKFIVENEFIRTQTERLSKLKK